MKETKLEAYSRFDEYAYIDGLPPRPSEFHYVKLFLFHFGHGDRFSDLIETIEKSFATKYGIAMNDVYIIDDEYDYCVLHLMAWVEMNESQKNRFITLKEKELAQKKKAAEKAKELRAKARQREKEKKLAMYQKLKKEFEG